MYYSDAAAPDLSALRMRISHRLGYLSKMCDDTPLSSTRTVSTRIPEDFDLISTKSSILTAANDEYDSSLQTSPPSSIQRTMSDPSLRMSCESPMAYLESPSQRLVSQTMTPPRKYHLQNQDFSLMASFLTPERHRTAGRQLDRQLKKRSMSVRRDLDLAGSPDAERQCRQAAAQLDRDTKRQAAKLGAADPYVECLRTQAIDLRRRADHLRWNRLVTLHETNVEDAMRAVDEGANIDVLEDAVMCAHNSALGPGHRSVREGKAYILRWRKQRQHQANVRVEEHHQRHLAEAIEHGDLYILSEAIEEAAAGLGSAHPSVEAARCALKEQRKDMQCSRWTALVEEHTLLMLQACATNDIQQISARIYATALSELGVGHPMVEHGKECIRNLKRQAQHAKLNFHREECIVMLNAPAVRDALAASLSCR